jgi:hypothetical protein
VIVEKPHPFGFDEDVVIFPQNNQRHFRTIKIIKTMISVCATVDIIHMHGLQNSIYLKAMKISRSKKVFHYHSDLVRYEPDPPEGQFHAKFVAIPTRLKVIENSVWIPLPVDTVNKKITEQKIERDEVIVGVGSDFSDHTKGKFLRMDLVKKAIENLQHKGYKIKTLEFKRYHEVLQYWKKIDIWLDRFHLGFYGFSEAEAASCGIPVVCEIAEDMEQYVYECPFLRTKPSVESIESHLEYLLSFSNRNNLGKKCREYAIQKHDVVKVAKICLNAYEKIMHK